MSNHRPLTARNRPARKADIPKPAKPAVDYYRQSKLKGLRYDYGLIEEDKRERVQELALEIIAHSRSATRSILAMGNSLLVAKEFVPHGKFSQWVEAEFYLSDRMAQNMMNAARVFDTDEKRNTVSLFSDVALYLLASPSSSEEAIEIATQEAKEKGRSPTRVRIRQIIQGGEPIAPVAPPSGKEGAERRFTGAHGSILYLGDKPNKGAFVVYALIDPRRDQVYYVGATNDFERRMAQHLNEGAPALQRRKDEISAAGEDSIARILANAKDFDECRDLEREYISRYYATLVNSANPPEITAAYTVASAPAPTPFDVAPLPCSALILRGEAAQASKPPLSKIDIINRDLDAYEAAAQREIDQMLEPEPPAPLTFDEWLAAMPSDLSLRECAAILELAKTTAKRTLEFPHIRQNALVQRAQYDAVYGALQAWSRLIGVTKKAVE